jgi:hypothetical protein
MDGAQTISPTPSADALAQIAQHIGPWAVVALGALFVTYKLGVAWIRARAEQRELETKALKDLADRVVVLERDQRQDTDRLETKINILRHSIRDLEHGISPAHTHSLDDAP